MCILALHFLSSRAQHQNYWKLGKRGSGFEPGALQQLWSSSPVLTIVLSVKRIYSLQLTFSNCCLAFSWSLSPLAKMAQNPQLKPKWALSSVFLSIGKCKARAGIPRCSSSCQRPKTQQKETRWAADWVWLLPNTTAGFSVQKL